MLLLLLLPKLFSYPARFTSLFKPGELLFGFWFLVLGYGIACLASKFGFLTNMQCWMHLSGFVHAPYNITHGTQLSRQNNVCLHVSLYKSIHMHNQCQNERYSEFCVQPMILDQWLLGMTTSFVQVCLGLLTGNTRSTA